MTAEACKKKAKELLEIYEKTSNPDCLTHAAIYCFVVGGEGSLKIFENLKSHYSEALKKAGSLVEKINVVDGEIEQLNNLIPSQNINSIQTTHFSDIKNAIEECRAAIFVFKNIAKYKKELLQVRTEILSKTRLREPIIAVCEKYKENYKLKMELMKTRSFNLTQLRSNPELARDQGQLSVERVRELSNNRALTQANLNQDNINQELKNILELGFVDMDKPALLAIFAVLGYGLLSLGDALKTYEKQ